jgi:hypothetical protein
VNVLSGILRDARDGGPIHQVNKGQRKTAAHLVSYKAMQGVLGSRYVSFPRDVFEAALLSQLRELDPKELLPNHDPAADRVAVLAGRYAELEDRVEKIKVQLVAGGDLAPLVDVLRAVDAERAAAGKELAAAQREASKPLGAAWGESRSLIDALTSAPDRKDARARLRAALRRIVSEVRCLFVAVNDLVRLAAILVWFEGGRHRDYVIFHPRRRGIVEEACCLVRPSRAFPARRKGEFDLRNPADAAELEYSAASPPVDLCHSG